MLNEKGHRGAMAFGKIFICCLISGSDGRGFVNPALDIFFVAWLVVYQEDIFF